LDAIAACVIGGVSLAGGEGRVALAVAGALIIGSLRNVLDLLGVHPFFQNVLVGTIIILVVFASGLSRWRRAVPA
jgi:ribose transport system permease protein